jgi:hypothetical protein
MYTITARDPRIQQLLRCGAPELLISHLDTERIPGVEATHRFFVSFRSVEAAYPQILAHLLFHAGAGQGISVTLEQAHFLTTDDSHEEIADEEERDAIAVAVLLYIAGERLMEIKERQETKRQILDELNRLGRGQEEQSERVEGPNTTSEGLDA